MTTLQRAAAVLCLILVICSQSAAQIRTQSLDSTFHVLSLPELQSYRRYYIQEYQSLQEEKQQLIQKGIDDGERLLAVNPDARMVDEILIRLADLYYYQAKDEYITHMDEYEQAVVRAERTGEEVSLPEPELDLMKPLKMYQRVIDEMPQSDLVDDAVYNKAYLYEEMGEHEKANAIYLYLIEAFPNSTFVPEAYMRLGEYYFNPPVNDLEQAITYYRAIGNYKTNARYGESLYKLGWSYYRLSEYVQAISYFTALVEDVNLSRRYDPEGESAGADLMDEALEYIAVSFHDYGGPAKAVDYLEGIGRPEWSSEVMRRLGDVYMEQKEEYLNAIAAYRHFLDFAPYAADAPVTMRKIVDCYSFMDSRDEAFDERLKLFLTYKKGSSWWDSTEDESARLTAYRLTEQALRENINSLIEQAAGSSSAGLYEKAVELGTTYLENFPEDEYAYLIRWNIALILDTHLHRYKQALQEYLTICMVYNTRKYEEFARNKGLAAIRDAAANAIVVSDSLVAAEQRRTAGADADAPSGDEPQPLSAAESWQAMAYDNYIKLFPFDMENTPLILANAGALYYIHNQYSEALKYFNTLMQYFPESDQVETVKLSILDSYFGKKDYQSAELLAKRIIASKPGQETEALVRRRLGEAMFLNAQQLADDNNSELAAREFHRTALEAPAMDFADRALFNAALHYERSGNLQAAIDVYEKLSTVYTTSPLIQDVYNNLAVDYAETGNYARAARYYEKLAQRTEDPSRRYDARYNSFVYYKQAKEFTSAVAAGEQYTQAYPDSADAALISFQIAQCQFALGDTVGGMRRFEAFPGTFSDSPLTVEALFRLGQFYRSRGETAEAENAFRNAHETGETLLESGTDVNGHYLSEALYFQTKLMHSRFNEIRLELPADRFERRLKEKQTLLAELNGSYTKIAAYKGARLPEAVVSRGLVFEDFARAWQQQELPVLSEEELAVRRNEINERALVIYERALAAYKDAFSVLNKFGNNSSAAAVDTAAAAPADDRDWQAAAGEKISGILYGMAEINSQSLERFLAAPVPDDLDTVARLEYRNQLLFKIAGPLTQKIIDAHMRNLLVSDSLGIDNRWRRESLNRILGSSLMLFREYSDLTLDALTSLSGLSSTYEQQALIGRTGPSEALPTAMINLTELSKTYSKAAVHFFSEAVTGARQIPGRADVSPYVHNDLINFALTTTDTIDILLALEEERRRRADVLFQAEESLLFEEALTVFEDNIYFLEDSRRQILETVYAVSGELAPGDLHRNRLLVRMQTYDPQGAAETWKDAFREMTVSTDSSWAYHKGLPKGGTASLAGTEGWKNPVQTASGLVWGRGSAGAETAAAADTVLIRKKFRIPGHPVSGLLRCNAGQPEHIVINSVKIGRTEGSEYILPAKNLRRGDNLLLVMSKRGQGFSFYADAVIRYIPLPEEGKTE